MGKHINLIYEDINQMTTLKKMKKTELIKLIKAYETEIEELNYRENNREIETQLIYMRDDVDTKTTAYLKKRIDVVSDEHRRAVYVRELQRINQNQRSILVN